MKQYVTVGLAVLAGAALIEAALIPGLVIGGAAMLVPKVLPKLRRPGRRPRANSTVRRAEPAASLPRLLGVKTAQAAADRLAIKQAIAKTVTFRIIVTTLDFSSNYIVLGELTTAAGLSTFALVVGPLFYLAHETAWNYFGPADGAVEISSLLPLRTDAQEAGRRGFTISRALAKTITFRTLATAMDFTTLYVVVGDAITAAGLAAFGFVVGPFVYWGHEKAWDHFASSQESGVDQAPPIKRPTKLLPAAANAQPRIKSN
jgi:uncharacterized membrane protein